MNDYQPYKQPETFAFKGMTDAILHFIAAICSVEASRFLVYTANHPSKDDPNMRTYLNAYTIADWANGRIDPMAWLYKEPKARQHLEEWAKAMIEFSSFFRDRKILNPTAYLSDKDLIYWDQEKNSWLPNIATINKTLIAPKGK